MKDEVVISGVGGHFPECDSLQELREKLLRNDHLISDPSGDLQPRYTGGAGSSLEPGSEAPGLDKENLRSGKMRYGDKFDNTFFGMHSRLAAATDSITRHVLETTLEAVIDAGYSPKDLHGSNTAVFMGYHCSESESNFIRESADGFGIMGLNAAMTANRVSYWLDLKGTSFTHNTQLVSGMQGLDMAFRALSKGECDRALVGAASLSYLAELATHYDDLGWLSTSGSCKPFDAAADGGVRSEAVVVMLLERRSTAQRVYAEVVHASSAMCAELSRAELPCLERRVLAHQLNAFYSECGVNPDHIEYLEADGWGVRSVDEAEIGALDDAIASRRTRPLLIGSVKGNIGQVEAASGLAAVCKVLVAMESGTIPATINHVDPSSQLAGVRHGRIQVVTENTPLVHGYVAVNNLGVGGILGHVLLRPNPRAKLPLADATAAAADSPIPKLLLMSGRTPEGLEVVIGTAEQSASDSEYVHLVHRAFSSHIFGHMYRGYSLVPKADEQVKAPTKFYTGQTRPIWFVYSGMGSQWPGMGADLMRIPVFAAAVERCHNALLPLGLDLKHIITTKDPKIYDNILHSFVGIAAVQVGLTDVLHAVGIEPYGIIGHSVGELGCAYADGCITAEQMMLAAHARGQASNETELVPGMMAAVGMGYKDIKDMVPEAIEVACHNSATSCTLSGPTADLDAFVAELKAKGIFARTVNVSNIAYHSRYIKPAAPRLLQLLQGVLKEPRARSPRWISTSVRPATKKGPDTTRASAEYFTNNLLSSVYFEEGTDQMDKNALAIEIAPHGLLQAILKRSLSQDAVNVAMTKRDMPGATMVLDALGKMYMEGLNPQVAALYPSVETPVCRGTATLAPLATWDHRDSWPVAFLKAPPESGPRTELHLPLSLTTDEFAHLSDCKWNGHSLLTPGTILNLVLSIVFSSASKDKPIVLENVVFLKSVVVPEDGSDEVYVFVQRGSGRFEVSVKERMVATGTVTVVEDADRERQCLDRPPSTVPREERVAHGADYIYEELGRRGLRCHGHLRGLLQLQRGARAVLATVADSADRGTQLDAILQMVTLQRSEGRHELHHARRIQRIVIDPTKALPAGSEQALHFDPAHHSIRLASSSGQVDVVLVETRALPLAPTYAPILVQGKTFLPYGSRDAVKDLLHLASLSLQLVANQGRLPLQVAAIGVPDSSRALLDAVLFVAEQQLPDLHVKVTVDGGSEGAALLLSDASDLQGALTAVRRQRGMLLARLPAGFAPPAELHELLALDVGRVRYALLKHTADVDPNSEVLHAGEGGELPQQRLALAQGAVVYLVFRGVHTQRIPGMVRAVASVPAGNRAHCVFLQDAAAPSFDLRGPQYAAQLRLGLRVNVLQGGRWGGVHRVHFANLSAGAPGSDSLTRTRQLAMDGMQLQYLGVNPYSDSVEDARTAVGLLDYAARRADGQRVMGVCSSSAGPLHPDPVLSWPVPQGWSDEDAGTVPLAYATALYVIHEQLAVRAGERALVVGGTTALGQAAITLLLAMKCPVFATVRDQHEHAELRDRFPSPSLDVLVGSVEEYTRELRRRSRGLSCVDVVLCQGAPSEVKAAMTILKKYGRTAHVGADHSLLSENLGLGSFITSTALFSLGWNWPLTARADDKARVRDAMLTAIQQGAVRPLPRRTAPPQALAESQRRAVEGAGKVLLSMKGEVFRTPSTLDPNCSCLVVGGPTARAVSVSEWLLSSGARDVSVSASLGGRAAGSAWLGRRLALMAAHYGAAVRTLPPGDIQQAVRAAAQVSPLGLVMALAQQPDRVRALDAATRTAGCTLVVLAEGAQLRQDDLDELGALVRCRREQGYSGVLATLGDLADDVRLLPLDQVLRSASNPVTHSVDVLQLKPSSDIEVTEGASAALPMLLPSSAEALRRLGLSQPASVTQRVLPSLIGGPADRRNKEVPPVFLVGGLSDAAVHELGPLALQLMATAVVVTPATGAASVEEAAEDVVSAVLRTQPLGPYTVAGRGWGGLVALEAVRALVRRKGCHATAFLLDASPDALQAALSPLRNQPSGLPTALLKYLLKLDCEAEELVYRAPDWSTRMQLALGGRDSVLESVLTCLLQRVQSIVNYSPAALDSKVGVSLVSDHRHHLQSAILSEISTSVRAHPLPALEDEAVRNKQCASVLSAGVHVGRSTMMERRALASLTVVF